MIKKKNIIVLLVAMVLSLSIVGCSKSADSSSKSVDTTKQEQTQETKKEEVKKELNTQTVEGLTLTVTSKIQAIKGDRTKDNTADDKGEYFADGSNIVKASDYKKIVINVDVKNDTDKVVQMTKFYWGAELQDGYKLNQMITGDEKDVQVQAKSNGTYQFDFTVKKDVKADKIKLTYLWVKNENEFNKLMKDPNASKMSEEEVKAKYKDVFTGIDLEADIQK